MLHVAINNSTHFRIVFFSFYRRKAFSISHSYYFHYTARKKTASSANYGFNISLRVQHVSINYTLVYCNNFLPSFFSCSCWISLTICLQSMRALKALAKAKRRKIINFSIWSMKLVDWLVPEKLRPHSSNTLALRST